MFRAGRLTRRGRDSYVLAGFACLVLSRTLYAMAFVYPPTFHDVWPTPPHASPLRLHAATVLRALVNLLGQTFLFVALFNLVGGDPRNAWKHACVALLGLFCFLGTNTFLPNAHLDADGEADGADEAGAGAAQGADAAQRLAPLSGPDVRAGGGAPPPPLPRSGSGWLSVNADGDGLAWPGVPSSLPPPPSHPAALMPTLAAEESPGDGRDGGGPGDDDAPAVDTAAAEAAREAGRPLPAAGFSASSLPRLLFVTSPLAQAHPAAADDVSVYFVARTVLAMGAQCVHGVGVWQLLDACLFPETWLRNGLYITLGLVLMAATGTLLDNACIAPMQANVLFAPDALDHAVSAAPPGLHVASDSGGQQGLAGAGSPAGATLPPPPPPQGWRAPRRFSRVSTVSSGLTLFGGGGGVTRPPRGRPSLAEVDEEAAGGAADDDDPLLGLEAASVVDSAQGGVGAPPRLPWHPRRRRWSAVGVLVGSPARGSGVMVPAAATGSPLKNTQN